MQKEWILESIGGGLSMNLQTEKCKWYTEFAFT